METKNVSNVSAAIYSDLKMALKDILIINTYKSIS